MPKFDMEQAYNDLKQKFDKLEENITASQAMLRKEIELKETAVKQREERVSELQAEITNLKVELSKKDGDRELLNEKIAQLQKSVESLGEEKARLNEEKAGLEREKNNLVATFKAEQDRTTEQMQNLHAHLDRVEEQIKAFGDSGKLARAKDEGEGKEKEILLKAKITAETKAQSLEKDLQDVRRKMRETGDGLLGSSMEIESLKEKLKEREQELKKINERVLSLTTGNTGVIMEMADLVKIMKEKFVQGKRNVRVVLPNITDFEQFIPLLEKLPTQAVVNLAASMDAATQEDLINSLREKKVLLTNFQENMYGLNVDGSLVILTLVATDNPKKILAGFYTDIEAAVPIFKDAIQKAWVKGVKM